MNLMIRYLGKDVVENTGAQTSSLLFLGLLALALLVIIYEVIRRRK